MPTSVIEQIRRVVGDGLRDGELLGRFIDRRDEGALAALVNRHGPMVWGVCRRLLGHHDAEDAFQATFIVLVKKASSITQRELVGNWLYGVAHQTALQARRSAARRKAREIQVVQLPDTEAPPDRWADVRPILDEELSRLPDHYRAVIVLCDLEGRTRRDVAVHLGCPEGTVASRLVRARAMLANRLSQRGVTLSGWALAAAMSLNAASAGLPASVVMSTIKAAGLCAAGQAVIPVKVAALAEGVLKTMLMNKLKPALAVLLVATMVGVIGFGIAMGQQTGDVPEKQESEKAQKGDVPQKDAKPKVEAAVKEKAEKKETIAWGKEVDGLQLGLVADADSYRQGETAKFAVKLRNVGKAEVTVTYSVLRESAPQVTTSDGGKVSVFMPAPFGNYAPPIKRVIKPGETITLYKPEVAVEPEALMRLKGIMRVTTPTICVDPGKYKIAYGGMIQSHPKLATETVEFEVKEPVAAEKAETAWGQEVDGLQIGLADAHPVRQGESIKFTVKLRNVGKAAVKISHGLLEECAPQITNADGGRVALAMPPILGIYVVPTERVIKPGETVTLYNPTVAVESEDRAKLDGELLVKVPTIFVGPGKYKIAFPRMVQSHPKLTTGTVEFEVKPAKESATAWGKEVDGMQVGILFGEHRAYKVGETVTLTVRLRNNGKKDVPFSYYEEYFQKNPPLITDADGKVVKIKERNIFGIIENSSVAPGKEVDLCILPLDLRPDSDRKKGEPWTLYGTGKFHIQYKDVPVVGEPRLGSPATASATGKLELEVKEDKKPAIGNPDKKPVEPEQKDKEAFTEWGKEVGGLQAGVGYKAGEKRAYTQGETVTLVIRVRNVGKEAVKFRYCREFFFENPPALTDAKGKPILLERDRADGFAALVPVDLAPGKEIEVGERRLELKPTLYGAGKFSVQYEQLETPANDITLSKLATGKLELAVTEKK